MISNAFGGKVRRVLLVMLLPLAISTTARAQALTVRVDPGVELMAIAYRLAGRSEYNLTRAPAWAQAVDAHFAPFKEHPAVLTARRTGFGFFIPMNLVLHLSAPPELAERTRFESIPSLHRRWNSLPDSTRAFVTRLQAFARETGFARFLAANQLLIDTTTVRLQRVAATIDRTWIDRFWGGPAVMSSVVVAGLTTGGVSYGQEYLPPGGTQEAWAILGVTRVDAHGLPLFDSADEPTLLHEMNHPYVSPLVRAHGESFRPSIDSLYNSVAAAMRAQAYGTWDAMLNESLVRAAVVRYYVAKGDSQLAERQVQSEIEQSFTWTRELVDLLGEYERNRTAYPTMRDFVPRLAAFFRDRAARQPR